ncbi:MAG: hypothetical protein P4L03_00565 [Terracidiphilus sp.]|nr:hypothetical protein [Terracidiphilus sp.]
MSGGQPAAPAAAATPTAANEPPPSVENGKKVKAPRVDQSDEFSSKNKKKKGLKKLNPF